MVLSYPTICWNCFTGVLPGRSLIFEKIRTSLGNKTELVGKKVEFYKPVLISGSDPPKYETVSEGMATFQGFGVDSEGEGQYYSTAIIKLPDGKIRNVYVVNIRFID